MPWVLVTGGESLLAAQRYDSYEPGDLFPRVIRACDDDGRTVHVQGSRIDFVFRCHESELSERKMHWREMGESVAGAIGEIPA